MPLVQVSLLKGRSPDYLRAIGDGVHEALVEAFGIPADDRFQLFRQHEREEFVCDPGYLGIQRSDDAVFIHIVAGNWRDTAKKKALYRAIADKLARAPGLRREDVQVVLSTNGREDWSFGNGEASYVKDEPA
jgi:phenylpyruvate tautomerase PptA (4-oxalocrotonate tautomerase family)